jgi:DNA-binding LacI/PurR family transcriptional regulator
LSVIPRQDGVMARVTLQTIADRVGVSRMTVSNAFSRPDQLSAELRDRILAVADELGYVGPNPTARALVTGTTGAVGVLLTDSLRTAFTDDVATGFLGSLVEGLAPTGLALTLLTTGDHPDVVPARDVAIDGAVVYSCDLESEARQWLLRRQLPLVFVDQDPVPGVSSVNVDDRTGARAAAQHLVDNGHREISIVNVVIDGAEGLVADPLAGIAAHPPRQRMLGWLDALGPAGIMPTVVQIRDGRADAADAAHTVLCARPRPTAVICFSDMVALEVVLVARELGIDVPGELSVVGFDDAPLARHCEPPLTTVHQDVGAKGRRAAEAIVSAMSSARAGTRGRVRHWTLPTELVVRESTGAAP